MALGHDIPTIGRCTSVRGLWSCPPSRDGALLAGRPLGASRSEPRGASRNPQLDRRGERVRQVHAAADRRWVDFTFERKGARAIESRLRPRAPAGPAEVHSATQYLENMGRMRGMTSRAVMESGREFLERLGLQPSSEMPWETLSKGNRQKVLVAQALLGPTGSRRSRRALQRARRPSGGVALDN